MAGRDLSVVWIDHGREPRQQPNPLYPEGIDLDITNGAKTWCERPLPWPAKRCGVYLIQCSQCGQKVMVTTAGRQDDPRSVKVACANTTGSRS